MNEEMPSSCSICLIPKALLSCGLCQCSLCKKCACILPEDSFSFLKLIPANLSHKVYCTPCFNQHVEAELAAYQETLLRAREIQIYDKTQGKETRLLKRKAEAFVVSNCLDREEALLRLAFFAVQGNYNTLIDVEVTSQKVKMDGYQTSRWQGRGIPIAIPIPLTS